MGSEAFSFPRQRQRSEFAFPSRTFSCMHDFFSFDDWSLVAFVVKTSRCCLTPTPPFREERPFLPWRSLGSFSPPTHLCLSSESTHALQNHQYLVVGIFDISKRNAPSWPLGYPLGRKRRNLHSAGNPAASRPEKAFAAERRSLAQKSVWAREQQSPLGLVARNVNRPHRHDYRPLQAPLPRHAVPAARVVALRGRGLEHVLPLDFADQRASS